MNRHHMVELGSSLLQEASFERSLDVFEDGAAFGRSDPLAGATERIIVGQPVCIGTGLMGIISTQTNNEGCVEVLVAPLQEAKLESSTIVRPLNWKPENLFDTSVFSTKLLDMDKIPTNDYIALCVVNFRSIAASKRLTPCIKFSSILSEKTYKNSLQVCTSYGSWTDSEVSHLITEVHWKWPENYKHASNSFGITEIKSDRSKSYITEYFFRDSVRKITCEINSRKLLDAQDVPFGVDATCIVMRQQVRFVRGFFSIILGREWRGSTNVEAEENLLNSRGTCVAIIETIDGESLLNSRCTDGQLSNAFTSRIPT